MAWWCWAPSPLGKQPATPKLPELPIVHPISRQRPSRECGPSRTKGARSRSGSQLQSQSADALGPWRELPTQGQKLLALPTCPHYVFVVSSEHHEKRNDSFNGPVGINTVRIRALLRLYERQFGDQRSKRQAVRQPEARSCRTSEPFLASL